MADANILQGIIVGGVGGAAAGIAVYAIQWLHNKVIDTIDSRKIHRWLVSNTSDEPGKRFKSTRTIASWNNLSQDRVRNLCSLDKRIHLSTGEKEDVWSIHIREDIPRVRS